MSVNRENAIWKSPNGEWKMGLYSYEVTGEDYEWDVDYDYSSFSMVISGGKSAEDCIEKYFRTNANAAGYSVFPDEPSSSKAVEKFEKMHEALKQKIAERKKARW